MDLWLALGLGWGLRASKSDVCLQRVLLTNQGFRALGLGLHPPHENCPAHPDEQHHERTPKPQNDALGVWGGSCLGGGNCKEIIIVTLKDSTGEGPVCSISLK